MMTITERIMELCTDKGWTLRMLSEEAGLSEGTIYKWKRGKEPTTTTLNKVCKAFGITEFQFLTGCYADGLSDGQKFLLDRWGCLTDIEKDALLNLMNIFIISRSEATNVSALDQDNNECRTV